VDGLNTSSAKIERGLERRSLAGRLDRLRELRILPEPIRTKDRLQGAAQNQRGSSGHRIPAEPGLCQIEGAKLAVEEIKKMGGVVGRPIELVIEDNQATRPGTVPAFNFAGGLSNISIAVQRAQCKISALFRFPNPPAGNLAC
jgi:hypothetical protein